VSGHAVPSSPDDRRADRPSVPEPTYAERARTLAHVGRTGALATLSRRHPGHPFASVMPYALDEVGRPLFLISALAMHTQNLAADPRASLLVAQADSVPGESEGSREPDAGADALRHGVSVSRTPRDPLAQPRVTLMGQARPVAADEGAAVRAAYLARHAHAAYWVDFEDFAFWRLEVADVYFVGGFAAMDWVTAEAYRAARPDPLAEAAPGILEHMNRDHADALLTYARVLAGEPADEATMVTVDRLGFRLRVRAGERRHSVRLAFPREVVTAEAARRALIEMLREARRRR
jgi:putative heme iron utilization protein